jgi:DNA-binding NarL/FixJ family response regulator
VWIVEDDRHFRASVETLLGETEDITCTAAFEACEDALADAEARGGPDVVLLDIELPGMSGLHGIQRLKQLSPTTHVVMLTVHEDNDKIFRAICAGASGYLLKPSSAEQIVRAVRATRQGGAPINPQIASKVLGMFADMAVPKGDYDLTDREREVLQELAEGKTTQRIADEMDRSYHTVDMHVRNIYTKLHVHSRSGAVAKALKERLI